MIRFTLLPRAADDYDRAAMKYRRPNPPGGPRRGRPQGGQAVAAAESAGAWDAAEIGGTPRTSARHIGT